MAKQTQIQFRKGTASAWTSSNPTLEIGEMGFESDALKLKIGDGSTPWNQLSYFKLDGGEVGSNITKQVSIGSNVEINFIGQINNDPGIALVFSNVQNSGTATFVKINNNTLNNSLGSYNISTTSVFTGDVFVKFILPSNTNESLFNSIRIFKYSNGTTTDVTVLSGIYAPNFSTKTIYANFTNLSEFYIIPNITYLYFDPNKLGNYMLLSSENYTVEFTSPDVIETTVLTNYAIKSGEKVVYSMSIDTWAPISAYTGVGIANNQFLIDAYLGQDTNSIGLYDEGSVYINGNISSSLNLNFQQDASVVDIAVDRQNNLIWFRVNGGSWNGDAAQNPATAAGGIDISFITGDVYAGASPYSTYQKSGLISIRNSVSSAPQGFNVLVGNKSQVGEVINFHFNGAEDNNWSNLNNWWLNSGFTTPAQNLPGSNDVVKIYSDVQLNSGSVPTVKKMYVVFNGYNGTADENPYDTNFGIEANVTEVATFYRGAQLYNYNGYPSIAKINGDCIFKLESGISYNLTLEDSVVNGNVTFYGHSSNDGTINGDVIFNDISLNIYEGIINGNVIFNDLSVNQGTTENGGGINGNATFNNDSVNDGTINGNAIFNDNSNNNGTVTGTVTCNTTGSC